MMQTIMKRFENIVDNVKDIHINFSGDSHKVDAHAVSIKQHEQQLGQSSTMVNPRQRGTLPNITIQNPKNNASKLYNIPKMCKLQ